MRIVFYNVLVFIVIALIFPMRLTAQHSILDKKISLTISNLSLEAALEKLEQEINYSFSYKSNLIKINSIVNLTATNKSVKELITTLINDQTISYIVIGKNIVFVKNSSITKPPHISVAKKKIPIQNIKSAKSGFDTTHIASIQIIDTLTIDSSKSPEPIQFIEQIYYEPSATYAVEFYGSPAITTNKYEITNTDLTRNLNTIKESETPLTTHTAGLVMEYSRSNITIQTGVQYAAYKTKVDYNLSKTALDSNTILRYDTSYTRVPKLVVKYYISPAPGDTDWISIYDTINKIKITNPTYKIDTLYTRYKNTNSFSYLEIPLNIGYTLLRINNLTITANAGLRAGLYIKSKGETLAIDKENTMLTLNNIPLTKINMLYSISLGITYKLNERFAIVLQPYIKNNLYSMYQNYPLSLKTRLYGFNIGVKYLFKDLFNKWDL